MIYSYNIILTGLLLCAILPLHAISDTIDYKLPLLKTVPIIDGNINKDEWAGSIKSSNFLFTDGRDAPVTTYAHMAQNQSGLWFSFICKEPFSQSIKTNISSYQGRVWMDDGIEVFLDTNLDRQSYYHLVVNTSGAIFSEKCSIPPLSNFDGTWEPGIRWASQIETNKWTAELFIPFAALPDAQSGNWGINLCRNRASVSPAQYTCLTPTHGSFHQPKSFAEFKDIHIPSNISTSSWCNVKATCSSNSIILSGKAHYPKTTKSVRVLFENIAGHVFNSISLPSLKTPLNSKIQRPTTTVSALHLEALDEKQHVVGLSGRIPVHAEQPVAIYIPQPFFDIEQFVPIKWEVTTEIYTKAKKTTVCLLNNEKKTISTQSFDIKHEGACNVPINKLKPGKYTIRVNILASDKSLLASNSVSFEKLALPSVCSQVSLDQQGVLQVDGQPFLPICLYRLIPRQWGIYLKNTGFNTVHDMTAGAGRFRRVDEQDIEWTTSLDEIEACMDQAQALGLKVMFELGVYVKEVFEVEPGEENGRRLRQVVSRFRHHPALLGYYLVDEPYSHQFARTQRARALINAIDPNHPTLAPSLGRAFYYKPTSQLVDIFMLSSYPIPYRPVSEVGRQIDLARNLIGPNKPIWFVAQAVGLRGADWLPHPKELRCMVYQALVRDVTGLFFFSWFGDQPRQNGPLVNASPVFWDALKKLSREVDNFADSWLSAKPIEVACNIDSNLSLQVRKDNDNVWILAVNAEYAPAKLSIVTAKKIDWQEISTPTNQTKIINELVDQMESLGVSIWWAPTTALQGMSIQFKQQSTSVNKDNLSLTENGSFEDGDQNWKLENNAVIQTNQAFKGTNCLILSGSCKAVSTPIAVTAGEELMFSFYVSVDKQAKGMTVDAWGIVEDHDGIIIKRFPLTGWDERTAKDFPWDWMGGTFIMPEKASKLRISLGTKGNPGKTRYDALRIVDLEQLHKKRINHK